MTDFRALATRLSHPIALAACLLPIGPIAPATAAPKGVTISNAWFARAPDSAFLGFFTIANSGEKPLLMTGWQSPACHHLSFEETNGEVSGSALDKMTVPGGTKMAFVRGGYHLMCDGPTGTLQPGGTIPVTISFRSGQTLTAPFEIRDVSKPKHKPKPAANAPH